MVNFGSILVNKQNKTPCQASSLNEEPIISNLKLAQAVVAGSSFLHPQKPWIHTAGVLSKSEFEELEPKKSCLSQNTSWEKRLGLL
jgi:hypothetical protein